MVTVRDQFTIIGIVFDYLLKYSYDNGLKLFANVLITTTILHNLLLYQLLAAITKNILFSNFELKVIVAFEINFV